MEESPGPLEYEVALYREATNDDEFSNDLPVDQAVPLGTKLQLRATINTDSGEQNFARQMTHHIKPIVHFKLYFLHTVKLVTTLKP